MRRRFILVIVVLLTLAFPLVPIISRSWVTLAVYIGLASLVALGLVLLTGVGGMTSFGQAAFVGVSAYTTAVLTTVYAISPWLTLIPCLAVTGVSALVLGTVTVRLSGHYLPLGTIAWGLAVSFLFGTLPILGLQNGLYGLPPLVIGSYALIDSTSFYYVVWAMLGLSMVLTSNLLNSRIGRAIRALRGDGIVAESFGVNVAKAKLVVFVYAALLAGLSGWLYAHFQRAVSPSVFGVNAGIEFVLMAIVGGAGHVYGAVVGATIVTLLREQLQLALPKLLGSTGNFEVIAFGLLLIVILHVARDGVWPYIRRWWPAEPVALPKSKGEILVGHVKPARGSLLLEVKSARKQFGGLVAVNDVSFDLKAGEIVGLIGPNGAGKSTTFNLLTGVTPLSAGHVAFLGVDVADDGPNRVAARGVARTFQHVKVVPEASVLDNIALGAHLRGRRGAIAAMLRLNRGEESSILPEAAAQATRVGLGDKLERPAGNLALGQLRLLEIARGLCLDPILLLLDEPAAGLRHKEKVELSKLLRILRASGVTILLVEHDMDFVMNLVDRLVVLDFGTKIAEGKPEEVRSNPAVRKAYLGAAA